MIREELACSMFCGGVGLAPVFLFNVGRTWRSWNCLLIVGEVAAICRASRNNSRRESVSLSIFFVPSSKFFLVNFVLCAVV